MISNVMLVLDVNILVYAHDLDSSAFIPCRDWLAFEQGARLCTTDRDFARFAGLELINPLR